MNKIYLLIFSILLSAGFAAGQSPCLNYDTVAPAANCLDACVSCTFDGYYKGSTAGFTGSSLPGCFLKENDQWFAFWARGNTANFSITPSNCMQGKGIQVALYKDCSQVLACDYGCVTCGDSPRTLHYNNLEPGQWYYLVVDGFDGDICEFEINYQGPESPNPQYTNPPYLKITSLACPGRTVLARTFSSGESSYTWSVNYPEVLINGQTGPITLDGETGDSVHVYMPYSIMPFNDFPAIIEACMISSNICYSSPKVCDYTTVYEMLTYTYPDASVCKSDLPYTLPWGEQVWTGGIYRKIYPNIGTAWPLTDCDSAVYQTVRLLEDKQKSISRTICNGEGIWVCDTIFGTAGIHQRVCPAINGCDSTVTLDLQMLTPQAEIISPGGLLSCSNPVISLHAGNTVGDLAWQDLLSGEIFHDSLYTINHPGLYSLSATIPNNNLLCVARDTVEVWADSSSHLPYAYGVADGTLNCLTHEINLIGATLFAADSIWWTTPGGGAVSAPELKITEGGAYIFSAWADNADCASSDTIMVVPDTTMGVINVHDTTWNCNTQLLPLPLTTSLGTVLEFLWSGPPNFLSIYKNPLVVAPGAYTVTITNLSNSCTAVRMVNVEDIGIYPVVEYVVAADPDSTGMGVIDLSISGASPPYTVKWRYNGLSFATTEDLIHLFPGTYQATVKDALGCDTTLNITVPGPTSSTIVAIPESIRVIPNPFQDHLMVNISAPVSFPVFSLYSITGQCILRQPLSEGWNEMETSTIWTGMYFYRIEAEGRVVETGKVVKW
jgi:hypothetical protein